MPDLKDDLLRGAVEAAKYLGLERRTIYRMTERNELPHVKKGSIIFYRKSELDAAFVSNEVVAPAQPPKENKPRPVRVPPKDSASFADVLPIFMDMADTHNAVATAARVKNICKLAGIGGPGRGNAAYYTADEIWRAMLLFTLGLCGITPKNALECEEWCLPPKVGEWGYWTIEAPMGSIIRLDCGEIYRVASKHLPELFKPMAGNVVTIPARVAGEGVGG